MIRTGWIKFAAIALALFAGLLAVRYVRLHDADGHRPEDIVRLFLGAVQKRDHVRALAAWREGDKRAIESNWQMSFVEFCRQRFKVQSYELEFEDVDKGYHVIYFTGLENGQTKTFRFYVGRSGERWRLAEQLIHPVLPSPAKK